MKNFLFGIVLGFIIHMLYLDGLIIAQTYQVDKCPTTEKEYYKCLDVAHDFIYKYKGKFFGIYRLIPFEHVGYEHWRME